jgi:hypothetical protein
MFHATHASILTSGRSTPACRARFAAPRTLPYYDLTAIPGFGDRLKPRSIIRAGAFDQ